MMSRPDSTPDGIIVEENPEEGTWWEAEKVVGSRLDTFGRREYKIRWTGYGEEDDTWEPEDNLTDSLYELAKAHDEQCPPRKRKSEPSPPKQRPTKKVKPTIVDREDNSEEGTWWEAEKVVGSRLDAFGRREYKIRWIGCGEEDDTWEPGENLADSLYELAKEHDKQFPPRKGKPEPSPPKQRPAKTVKPTISVDRAPWALPEGSTGGSSIFALGPLTIDTLCHRADKTTSFATYYFGKRIVSVEVPFVRTAPVPPAVAKLDGYTLELLSSHYPSEGSGRGGRNVFVRSTKNVRFFYVTTSGPNLSSISLKEKLESIADFESLSAHKAKARLELLVSGSNQGTIVPRLTAKDFRRVREEHNQGCGYIPLDMLTRILGKRSAEMKILQVRIIAPKLGVFKGVLCPKPNISKIELPTSMKKVGPSVASEPADWACLIVKNVFPTNRNIQIGRELDADSVPSLSPFRFNEGPGEMVERLWRSLGVSKKVIGQYARGCKKRNSIAGLKHAYLVGVADPTGELPKGHVFLPGMGEEHGRHKQLFMTRSPCVEASDGRLVPVVTTKPSSMSPTNWMWINQFPFGIVIFAAPKARAAPLPQLLASGDLDGDCYFVCWDDTIVGNIPKKPVRPVVLAVENKLVPKPGARKADDWLCSAQDVMVDIALFSTVNQLMGKLWGANKRCADGSDRFMKDRFAVQFARAYKLSLDLSKHGGLLYVPEGVRKEVPKSLHDALSH